MKKLVSILCFSLFFSSFAQVQNESVVSESLTTNADAIIRFQSTNVTIKSIDQMLINYKKTVKVLNERGNKAYFLVNYDKFTSVNNIVIKIYNKFGKLIKRVKKKEVKDVASSDDSYTLFTDDRYKYYKYITNDYPYTITISYSIQTSNTAFIPKFYVFDDYAISIQEKKYAIVYPKGMQLNYKEYNFDNYKIEKKEQPNRISYNVSNVKPLLKERFAPSFTAISPHVSFALNKFSLAGVKGNATSWNAFGAWMNEKLLKGRNEIPEKTKREVQNLVSGVTDPVEKARLVYEYMQGKTRYISLQIGIGGWKPMLAKDVDELKYGDCKALTYYTKSLLDIVNVPSAYSIVFSGNYKKGIDKDLVSVQGNHAILMLPTKKDTIWLECTSQKLPFGQTGSTDDRDVMIIADNAGKIVHTKAYPAKNNYQEITGTAEIDNKGNLISNIAIRSSGKQYNNHFHIIYKKHKEQVKYYKNLFSNLIDVSIDSISFINDKKKIIFTEKIKMTTPNYAEVIENDMIFNTNFYNVRDLLPKKNLNRQHDLVLKFGYFDEDIIKIHLPDTYKISYLPKPVLINNQFGMYQMEILRVTDNELLFKRKLLMNDGKYPKSDYKQYRKFIKKIIKFDHQMIKITKK